ncbi:MAG: glucose-1-phosphate cytidylyltransferase [Candidatus Magasanikbacteria bacterium]|jgi:glucose-1-phosphate cytidylyltransferase|nr:glucose-1-phosphate cytidylyltransferase [Candidatus Magasanikbacteria bacterium]MBT4314821.1 glucose-1-phosphate cytidylyltransferase [Candidatus Magasanikbacteria bacterium]MBT4547598.1 glucose-1-phosphate cytidylyltransferase [Candidatus Magasanikbacteria bacterium]MBT6819228.1 glucose-1-phosphate cytidylyltransferase [Candidatus Magasanikbacteria bacterium]
MKTIILCGGTGTRMKEETEFKPKPLVSVGGKPILWHIMKIYAHYGFNDFILALGYKGDLIKDYFLHERTFVNDFTLNTKTGDMVMHNNHCDDFNVTLAETGLKSLTGERIKRLKKYIGNDEHFMVTYGDGVADIDISKLVEFHKEHGLVATITGVKPATRFGFLNIDADSKVINFAQHNVTTEDENEGAKDLINGGFMVFRRDIFDFIEDDSMIESVFSKLAKDGQVMVYNSPGRWKCMDNYKEVEEMNELWAKNPFWKVWN